MSDTPKRYWDAAVFIAWLNAETDRKPACEGYLDLAQRGKLTIVTSAMTLVEVVKYDKSALINLPSGAATTIEGFFRNSWISLRLVDPEIGELARGLMWDHAAMRVRDAIHIATALRYKLPFLDTYDDKMIALDDQFPDLTIGHPPMLPQQLSAEPLMAAPEVIAAAEATEAEFASLVPPPGMERADN